MLRSLVGSEMCIRDSIAGSQAWEGSETTRTSRRTRKRGPRPSGNRSRYRARRLHRSLHPDQRSVSVSSKAAGIGDTGFSPVPVPDVPGQPSGSSSGSSSPSALQLGIANPFDRIQEWQRRSVAAHGNTRTASGEDSGVTREWYGPSRANCFRDCGSQTEQSVKPDVQGCFVAVVPTVANDNRFPEN